ncbi:PEP-CTERM motif protein [Stieleria neptunia]|uniref:PEP-CTERM motif protein n=1 Tax=Stieleria neptunia TaxID=2527979 RepID=A0A518HIQ6_9BACT|nr:PEP-CTERM sorting domain-containing protein [Stieleria neptunia]QDV40670.1 PEP-CTERM motif protein [Stieleria neptunia]
MQQMKLLLTGCVVVLVTGSGRVNGGLVSRGAGLVYDDVLDVTWLQNGNYGAGSIFDDGVSATDGIMSWANAVAWADALVYYDSERDIFWDDWRLPKAKPVNGSSYNYVRSFDGSSDLGWNIVSTQSELSHLFYISLGNIGLKDVNGNNPPNEGLVDAPLDLADESLFLNIESAYWTGTPYMGPDVGAFPFAFDFIMGGGTQSRAFSGGADHFAWAVRDGDVATLAVPEPATLAIFGSGALGLAVTRRRRLI